MEKRLAALVPVRDWRNWLESSPPLFPICNREAGLAALSSGLQIRNSWDPHIFALSVVSASQDYGQMDLHLVIPLFFALHQPLCLVVSLRCTPGTAGGAGRAGSLKLNAIYQW